MSQWMLVPPLAALLFAWPGNAAAQAQALAGEVTTEEAGAGAAAVSVIALRCQPDAFVAIKKQAFEYLAVRLRDLSAEERERVLDAAERKLRALTVASDKTACADLANLRLMAQTWGYANLLMGQA